jgi:hypothetical protein
MAAAVVQEPEAPEVARITQIEDLPDPVRADIVARREAGETLAARPDDAPGKSSGTAAPAVTAGSDGG